MALGLGEPNKMKPRRKTTSTNSDNSMNQTSASKRGEEDLIFSLDEDQNMESYSNNGHQSIKLRKLSTSRTKFNSMRMSNHVNIFI